MHELSENVLAGLTRQMHKDNGGGRKPVWLMFPKDSAVCVGQDAWWVLESVVRNNANEIAYKHMERAEFTPQEILMMDW